MPIKVKRVPFDYAFPLLGLTGTTNSDQPQPLQLADDAPFEQVGWMMRVSPGQTFGSVVSPPVMRVIDQSNGWQFSNGGISILNFGCSTVALDLLIPFVVPYIWMPSSQAEVIVTDTTANGPLNWTLQLVMKGYKLFAPDGSQLSLYPEQQQAAA